MLHYAPQHVSSSTLLILRRTNCITTASGIVTFCKQPYSMQSQTQNTKQLNMNFHIRTVHRDIIKVFFIHQLMHK